ncbi:hypothetical protein BASA50_008707 [Batrachochytrium salamandrivorans]|uniref:Uncharacterized protein n=1 Tax=Batrachochytrium salamandrivorans TaxID=1357716 RepID=A0ABQ8F6I5_9FUNG|nr:hypothetical protein BASA50_008707 [Batrachochytrium salamandrivorans]
MKFNALVVAAMVIASVNASGADEPPSGAEYSGGRSNTELIQGSSGNGPGKSRESGLLNTIQNVILSSSIKQNMDQGRCS